MVDTEMLLLLVLSGLLGDIESIHSIAGVDEIADKKRFAEAIVRGVEQGLIEAKVYESGMRGGYAVAPRVPSVTDIAEDTEYPPTFWFDITPAGRRVYEERATELDHFLDAYFDANPPTDDAT